MLKNLLILFFLTEIKTEILYDYITDISFSIDKSINGSYDTLSKMGYQPIQGNIRQGVSGKVCAIGIKRFFETNKEAITNIIGTVSGKNQPQKIKEDGIEYTLIIDNRKNGDIHRNSKGNYLNLYYTRDKRAGKPIRDISVGSYSHDFIGSINNSYRKYCDMRAVNHSKISTSTGALDINIGRGGPYNYIIIFRA